MDGSDSTTTAMYGPGPFLAAHLDSLVRTAFLLVGTHHAAEDLVMNALSKCLPRWPTITGDPLPYVRKAVLHENFSVLRQLRIVREIPTAELPEPVVAGQDDVVALRSDLLAALARLPRRQRAVVVLRYLDDMSARQVADLLQISEGTVRSQTHDGLAALRAAAPNTLRSYLTATTEQDQRVNP